MIGWTMLWVLWLPAAAPGREPGPPDGAALFQRDCAQCHGPAGRGDGIDADLFAPPPRDLRSSTMAAYDRAALVARIRDGVPLSLALDPAALKRRSNTVEALVSHIQRLPTLDWRSIEAGEEIYVNACEACHGPLGIPPAVLPRGVPRPPDLATTHVRSIGERKALEAQIRHGHAGMPAVLGDDSQEDVDAVVSFVMLLSPGYQSWSRYCAGCHGDDGRGPGEFWSLTKRPTVVFDSAWLKHRDPEELRVEVWHMLAEEQPQMPHFPRLTEAQAGAIVDWLRAPAASPTP